MKWKRGLLKELGRSMITTLISPDNQCPDHCSASNIDPPQHIRSCSWSLYNSHLQQSLTPGSRSWSRIALHIPLPWKWCHPIKDHLSLNKSCILVEDYHQAKRHLIFSWHYCFLELLAVHLVADSEIRYTYHITSLVRLQNLSFVHYLATALLVVLIRKWVNSPTM